LCRLVEQELTDQLLDDHRRLRLGDVIAVFQHCRVASGIEADVDFPEQP